MCYCHTIVYMYSQVLNTSVADAFSYIGDPSKTEAETFIQYFDCLFDCLHVHMCLIAYMCRTDLKPYTSLEDCRLQVHKKEKSNCKLLIFCM